MMPDVSRIPGFLYDDEPEWLYSQAKEAPGLIVEVGSYMGKSTVCLAQGALDGHGGPVLSFDPQYIGKANALFSEQSIVDRKREVGKALSRLNFLYTANIKAGDLKAALDTEKAKAALLGLNAPTKLAHEGKEIKLIKEG